MLRAPRNRAPPPVGRVARHAGTPWSEAADASVERARYAPPRLLAGRGHREPLASLRAAPLDYRSSALGLHAGPETVRSSAANPTRLICTLHEGPFTRREARPQEGTEAREASRRLRQGQPELRRGSSPPAVLNGVSSARYAAISGPGVIRFLVGGSCLMAGQSLLRLRVESSINRERQHRHGLGLVLSEAAGTIPSTSFI